MTISFRVGRYLVLLLGNWSVPVLLGIALGTGLSTWQLTEEADLIEEILIRSIQSVVDSCEASTDPPLDTPSPAASVTGRLHPLDVPAELMPVAGDGGDTG
jgi:hypothetical protein